MKKNIEALRNLKHRIYGNEFTLLDLSNILVEDSDGVFEDMFNFNIERDILNLENMNGSFAGWDDGFADNIIYFTIEKLGEELNEFGNRTHLDTTVLVTNVELDLFEDEDEDEE